ncbi:MAG: S8 family serine peptidase [Solirubrobacteraceae bacterium]
MPLTIAPLAAAASGKLTNFTEPSPDRIANATDNELQDELLVMLGTTNQPGARAQADAAARAVGGVVAGGISDDGIYQIRWSTPQDLTARITQLQSQPNVTAVSPSIVGLAGPQSTYAPTVAPAYDQPYWTWRYDQVDASQAWSQTTGWNVTVGIVEVGDVYAADPDLNVTKTLDPIAVPGAHATDVAGLACGKADGDGMVGLAWGCPIVTTYAAATDVLKNGRPVLNSSGQPETEIPDASVMAAMQRVAGTPGVRVINMSLGADSGCATQAYRNNTI